MTLVLLTIAVTTLAIIIFANVRNPQKQMDYEIELPEDVRSEHFFHILSHLMGPPVLKGNSVKALYNGEQIFPAMLKAIKSAQQTICFESYIYWSGKIGSEFADALIERAQAGVRVHVLLDWMGSQRIEDDLVNKMKKGGVEVEYYHPLKWYNVSRMNNRTHRKILVVDGYWGFTGGVGIADEWSGNGMDPEHWRDTHYEVRGPVVSQMQSAFMDNWLKTRPEVHTSEKYFPIIANHGNVSAQMFKSTSREGASSVRIMYMLAIAAAKKSIYLENAYFVPDKKTIQELVKARNRGVKVEIIAPKLIDNDYVRLASREQWGPLLASGIKFYEYAPALFHCKVFIVDDFFVSIGSTNFDERSFRLNDEANLNIFDEEFAKSQVAQFEVDKSRSEEITWEKWNNRPWTEKTLEKISSIFSSQF